MPGRISIQGLPSCSRHPEYSSFVSDYCNDDDNVPVTWLYGGGLECELEVFSLMLECLHRLSNVDVISILAVYFGFANGTELTRYHEDNQTTGPYWINLGTPYDSPRHQANISQAYYPAITDALQLLNSCVRLDFGHILPNNPFLNMTMMNQTLQDPFPKELVDLVDGDWGTTLSGIGDEANFDGYRMSDFLKGNSTYINGEYQCRFWYSVGWGESSFHRPVLSSLDVYLPS